MRNEWISVKDRLPEEGEEIIIYANGLVCGGVIFDSNRFVWEYDSEEIDNVTYWMPLPEPPNE